MKGKKQAVPPRRGGRAQAPGGGNGGNQVLMLRTWAEKEHEVEITPLPKRKGMCPDSPDRDKGTRAALGLHQPPWTFLETGAVLFPL